MAAGPMDKVKATAEKIRRSAVGVARGRSSTIGARLIHPLLLGSDDGKGFSTVRGIARALTAAVQPVSTAQRTSIVHTAPPASATPGPVSPVEIQQWREQPSGPYWTADNDNVFLPRNTNPQRRDEYLSLSSQASSAHADAGTADTDIPTPPARSRRLDLDEEGSSWFWEERDDTPPLEMHAVAPDVERLLDQGNDSEAASFSTTKPERKANSPPHSLHELEANTPIPSENTRGHARFFDTDIDFTIIQAQPATTIPALETLTPRPRQRSRPLVRDALRRQGRVWDHEADHIFLTALEHATNIHAAETESISPHLSNQELEALGAPRLANQISKTGNRYADTDTTRYRALTGPQQQGSRKLPPPPPPKPVVTVQATVQDTRTGRGGDSYRPAPLIRSTDFRPFAGYSSHPRRKPVPGRTDRGGISGTLNRVGGYFTGGVDAVTSRAMELTPGRRRRREGSLRNEYHVTTSSAPLSDPCLLPPRGGGHGAEHRHTQRQHSRPSSNRSSSNNNNSHTPTRTRSTLKALAGLILTDQEFPSVLTRDGPGSRLPMHILRPNPPHPYRPRVVTSEQEAAAAAYESEVDKDGDRSWNSESSTRRRASEESLLSSGWRSDLSFPSPLPSPASSPPPSRPSSPTPSRPSSPEPSLVSPTSTPATSLDEQEDTGAEQEWKPLTVKTAEWVPFPGEWILEFRIECEVTR
ncbi:MAG: hypothetical protein LQ346_007628 [Caloplaca aetnensis]|nr:MAG: hypothetical protein LQ346_007628 [Caloplaca aetnensis]